MCMFASSLYMYGVFVVNCGLILHHFYSFAIGRVSSTISYRIRSLEDGFGSKTSAILYRDGPRGLGPFLKVFNESNLRYMSSRNVDTFAGSALGSVSESRKAFGKFLPELFRVHFNHR
ncbi:hypothetical protein H2248_008220 [Termitomyces sp. 'cryptogamus']|nr:hypothetical protein H2248_008220 [Termitomyces sp. 'cryptogamus']